MTEQQNTKTRSSGFGPRSAPHHNFSAALRLRRLLLFLALGAPVLSLLFTLFYGLPIPQPTYAATVEYEWILDQKHEKTGHQKIYLSKEAIRISNSERGFEILARAPDWKVEIRRPDNKTVLYMSLDQFPQFSVFGLLGKRTVRDYPYKLLGTYQREGLTLSRVAFSGQNTDLWTAESVPLSPEQRSILGTYYTMKVMPGMPILFCSSVASPKENEHIVNSNRKHAKLNTLSWSKGELSPADFDKCHGFREVHAIGEILVSDQIRHQIDEEFAKEEEPSK